MGECSTQIEQCRIEYKWTIQHFSLLLQSYDNDDNLTFNLKSSTFTSELRGQKTEWILGLYINEQDEELKTWISFTFDALSQGNVNITSFNISFVDHTRKQRSIYKCNTSFKLSRDKNTREIKKLYKKDIILKLGDTLLPNDTLTVIFEAVVRSDPFVVIGPEPIELPKCQVLKDCVDLFSSREGGDVTFTVRGENIKAHKATLMTRSAVFAAMFKHDMLENEKKCVNITDMKPLVFTESLRFIYTNQVYRIHELAEDLLQAANKYQIETLKRICEYELFQSLNVENAAQTLICVDNHNCPQLKTHTISFINKHGLDVIDTPGFEIMIKTHPQLLVALYCASY